MRSVKRMTWLLQAVLCTATTGIALVRVPGACKFQSQPTQRLTYAQARDYMLVLINRDRAAMNLAPVGMDAAAAMAGQRHCEEMASQRYLSHYNLAGKPPNQRYTEAGGTSYCRENVFLSSTRYRGAAKETADDVTGASSLIAAPDFSFSEIEAVESSYFNETPPNDGHRRNILAPEHTHVGIGLARAAYRDGRTLSNAQEFVDRYVDVEPIPESCAVGQDVRVAGRTIGSVKFRSVSVGHAPLPTPLSKELAAAMHSYAAPAADQVYWPAPYRSAKQVRLSRDGTFSIEVPLGRPHGAGLYYVGVWVEENDRDLLVSLRTVVVK